MVALIVSVAIYASRRGSVSAAPAGSGSSARALPPLPHARLLTDEERFRSLLAQVHGRGPETPELRALLDEQAALVAQALTPGGCQGSQCAQIKETFDPNRPRIRAGTRAQPSVTPDSAWRAGLLVPDFPVRDEPQVQREFQRYTGNPVLYEELKKMLFRCGAYGDSIRATLVRNGLPESLLAVVFAESACSPTVRSHMGAGGLWQFIPEAARAYRLLIIADVVDERDSPQKATEAAVRFLRDLYAKFGDWELALAAYNMGPFGLATRLTAIEGEKVGFWDLVDAKQLPKETAEYVPRIEAFALILNNLQRLKLMDSSPPPQLTAGLEVPPGTRLSLVARAASMNVNALRALNLDLKAMSTPAVPNFLVQVPKDSLWRARETLQYLLKSNDNADQCAPPTFDWGRQRFTPEMAKACERMQARAASPLGTAAEVSP